MHASRRVPHGRNQAALTTLAVADPAAGWGDFLLPAPDLYGNTIKWNSTVVSGHSRGSAYPLHIGYYWKPRRVVFFSGQEDYQGTRGAGSIRRPVSPWGGKHGLSTPAPWVLGYRERAKRLGTRREPFNFTPMGVNSIYFGSPHVHTPHGAYVW